ncbi:hypothetical protein ACRRTK_013725 [Alexandromys fortis]
MRSAPAGCGWRRNLTCPLVPGKVLRPAPFSEPARLGCRHVGEEKSPLRLLSKSPRRCAPPAGSHASASGGEYRLERQRRQRGAVAPVFAVRAPSLWRGC